MRRTRRRTRTQDKNVRYEEDKEEGEDTGKKCQVSERVTTRKSGHDATVASKCQVNGRVKSIKLLKGRTVSKSSLSISPNQA